MRTKQCAPKGFFYRFDIACYETGLNNAELAKLVGQERKSISAYRNREIVPPLMLVYEVSKRSGRSLNWIFEGKD